jgi:hypothetical protein
VYNLVHSLLSLRRCNLTLGLSNAKNPAPAKEKRLLVH